MEKTDETSGLVYGSTTFSGTVDDSNEKSSANSDYQSYYYTEPADTLPPAETSGDTYTEGEYDEYYDYDYAARINRFHNSCGDFGYYDPVYTNSASSCCGPNISFNMGVGYGWGYPYSSFSLGFGYGYPYYYSPWYDPWYSPWYYDPWYPAPYYGYGGYWAGYNAGYYNGYWNGYYAGGGYYPGYYPGGDYGYYPGDYYGPRTSRSGGVVNNDTGEDESRDSRIGGGNTLNSGISAGAVGQTSTSSSGNGTSKTTGNTRTSRQLKPAIGSATVTETENPEPQAEKLTKPVSGKSTSSRTQEKTTRAGVSHTLDEPARAAKLAKPVRQESVSGKSVASTSRQQHNTARSYVAPAGSRENGVIARTKKYAKPVANDLQKNTRTKTYSTPGYNRPRASNEYIVPNTGRIGGKHVSDDNVNQFIRTDRSKSAYTPSRSSNSFSQPRQSKSYTSPVRTGRSLSSPVQSSPAYSSPSRSSGFSPSRSTGTSRPTRSSSSGGGKRGR